MLELKKNKVITVVLYMTISFLLLGAVFFSPGVILGGDWGTPHTSSQLKNWVESWNETWTIHGNLFGEKVSVLTAVWLKLFNGIGLLANISGSFFYKIILFFLFFFAAYSMNSLLKFFKIRNGVAFFSGIVYVTLPIFFDYAIMGWIFVLFAMGLFPVAVKYFIKAVEENRLRYAVVVGIIYAISVIQSQAIFWFPMIFFLLGIYLIRDKKTFFYYFKTLLVVFLLFFLLNFYWIFGLLLIPDEGISGSDIVNSEVSLGILGNFQPHNFIRLFGSLFNFQYETVVAKSGLHFFSFFIPMLALGAFLVRDRRRLSLSFFLIAIIPLFFYFLNDFRQLLVYVPFSNVIRDFARFMVLSSFAYVVLFAISLNYIFTKSDKKIYYKYAGLGIIFLWFLSIFPWWTGELTNWKNSDGADMRIRTKVFPNDYIEIENIFAKKKLDQKALYLPLGGTVDFEDDSRFHGAFNETQDIFAGYSPIPGVLGISDRSHGHTDEFVKSIKNSNNYYEVLKNSNIKYFVVRKNLLMSNRDEILWNFENNQELYSFFEKDNIIVYLKNNFLTHFYTSKNNLVSQRTTKNLSSILSKDDLEIRSAVFFENQNVGKEDILKQVQDDKSSLKVINNEIAAASPRNDMTLEFKKINPTKYRVRVHSANGKFPLVFSESFHEGWKSYLVKTETPTSPQSSPQAGEAEILKKYRIIDGNQDDPNHKSGISDGASQALAKYKILDGNEDDQASKEELKEYINKGWVTDLDSNYGSKPQQNFDNFEGAREIRHMKWVDGKEELDYVEKYNIDFISKNFQGTIQNDNLPSGNIFETWFKKPLDGSSHLMVNGYANSWVIDTEKLCAPTSPQSSPQAGEDGVCIDNHNGSYDMEIVVEFWPQRLFYIGLAISGVTLLSCVFYLAFDFMRRKKLEVAGHSGLED